MLTLPNSLTLFRCFVVPVLVVLHFLSGALAQWIIIGLIIMAGASDYLDGHFARTLKVQSDFGRFLDSIADKLLIVACLLLLVEAGLIFKLDLIAALIIVLREILISGLREFMAGHGQLVRVTRLAKWKTTVQMMAVGFLYGGPVAPDWLPSDLIGQILLWMAAILSIMTAVDYLRATWSVLRNIRSEAN